MKKIIFAAIALACSLVTLNSCLKDNDSEYHQTSFYPNLPNGIETYADQTIDSIYVLSTDTWVAELKGQASAEVTWMNISPTRGKVDPGYILQQRVLISMQQNHTGKVRRSFIQLTTPDYGENQLMMPITQYPWLNIVAPQPVYSSTNINDAKVSFTANLTASDKTAILRFTVYDNATVSSDATWLEITGDKTSFEPGTHAVNFTVHPNNTDEGRTAHVTLTSGGISNTIDYKQAAKQ